MNILIIGDSWSKPDGYTEPQIPPNFAKTVLPLEYYLMSKGHTVFNRGEGGRGNMNSLRLGTYFVQMANHLNINIDLIIYFNSDLSRDRNTIYSASWDPITGKTVQKNYPKTLKEVSDEIYEYHKSNLNHLRKLYKGKWAIIGGCAPLYRPEDFSFADFIIEDWRSEILDHNVQSSQWLFDYPFLSQLDDLDNTEKEADIIENLWKVTRERIDLFPDQSHPNMELHQQLGERIHKHFCGDKL
jgi:hypothetical protein